MIEGSLKLTALNAIVDQCLAGLRDVDAEAKLTQDDLVNLWMLVMGIPEYHVDDPRGPLLVLAANLTRRLLDR